MSRNFSITHGTSATPKRAVFHAVKNTVLGKAYRLALIFVPAADIKKWNKIYRGKNQATDVLSFPLSKSEGEIYVCLAEAKKEAKKIGQPLSKFIVSLFIHGLVHLKGHDHGATMDSIEAKTRRKFRI